MDIEKKIDRITGLIHYFPEDKNSLINSVKSRVKNLDKMNEKIILNAEEVIANEVYFSILELHKSLAHINFHPSEIMCINPLKFEHNQNFVIIKK